MSINLRALFRRAIFLVHLWLGLVLGLYLVLMGVTGSLLVFMEDIRERVHRPAHSIEAKGERVSVDQAWEVVRQKYPDRRLNRVVLPTRPDATYEFLLAWPDGGWGPGDMLREVHVDPYTGKILGEGPRYGRFFNLVFYLHVDLLLGKTGRLISKYSSLSAALLLLTGIYLWWPAALKQWSIRLTVKRNASYRRLIHDLHNVLGAYPLPVLLLAVLTGVAIMFPKPVGELARWITGSQREPRVRVAKASRGESLPLGQLLHTGEVLLRERVPDAELTRIYPAKKPGQPIRFIGEFPQARPDTGYIQVRLDPATGRLLHFEDPRTAKEAKRLLRWIGPLHFGNWGGFGVKALYFIAGLAPLGLFLTGVLKWLEKRKAAGKNRLRRATKSLPGQELAWASNNNRKDAPSKVGASVD